MEDKSDDSAQIPAIPTNAVDSVKDAARRERKRKMDVIYARKRRERMKKEEDELNRECMALTSLNAKLHGETRRLEYLLSQAREILSGKSSSTGEGGQGRSITGQSPCAKPSPVFHPREPANILARQPGSIPFSPAYTTVNSNRDMSHTTSAYNTGQQQVTDQLSQQSLQLAMLSPLVNPPYQASRSSGNTTGNLMQLLERELNLRNQLVQMTNVQNSNDLSGLLSVLQARLSSTPATGGTAQAPTAMAPNWTVPTPPMSTMASFASHNTTESTAISIISSILQKNQAQEQSTLVQQANLAANSGNLATSGLFPFSNQVGTHHTGGMGPNQHISVQSQAQSNASNESSPAGRLLQSLLENSLRK